MRSTDTTRRGHYYHNSLCLSSLQPSDHCHSGSTHTDAASTGDPSSLLLLNAGCQHSSLPIATATPSLPLAANEQSMRSTGTTRRGHYHHNAYPIIYHLPVCCKNMYFHSSCILCSFLSIKHQHHSVMMLSWCCCCCCCI